MRKILIADDSFFMREMLRYILLDESGDECNIKIYEACDGFSAVEQYKAITPDLTLMDVVMPGKDGISALAEIKRIDDDAKVIMISQMKKESIIIDSLKLGASDFLLKPFDAERLVLAIRKIIGYDYLKNFGV